ncbi:MAG: DNA mismatch repair endonuclease MutL, partial [Alphaproteobacteria bacterium]|nr:DNA mismatch repair endonuclease MutL [Alphaproteobacteria bacterium]
MTVRLLHPTLINQIAAGEVVERPAAAVKELIENAIDAGANKIDVIIRDGGRSLISVTDNGTGMSKEDLELCVERHATSKLPNEDLFNIQFLGFRGEALPSIGAVSRLSITSRSKSSDTSWCLKIEGGDKSPATPASFPVGTKVEIRDLFFATPARLKFLKTPTTEFSHIQDVIQRQAMAHPKITFTLKNGDKTVSTLDGDSSEDGQLNRLKGIMGQEFSDNALLVTGNRDGVNLTGYAGIPTLNRGNATFQYLFVNGRPVRDRLLAGAIRAAYQDFLARDRHPLLALFIECPSEQVDVNVHPAKTEVRFRDGNFIRSLIVSSLRHALSGSGHQASTTVANQAINAFQTTPASGNTFPSYSQRPTSQSYATYPRSSGSPAPSATPSATLPEFDIHPSAKGAPYPVETPDDEATDYPLGAARAQIHETYIVAQTKDGLVVVDQHAAHERLVYERFKKSLAADGIKRQALLIPEVVNLTEDLAARLLAFKDDLKTFGLLIEGFGKDAILVRETPAILGTVDAQGLIKDLVDEIVSFGDALVLKEKIQ